MKDLSSAENDLGMMLIFLPNRMSSSGNTPDYWGERRRRFLFHHLPDTCPVETSKGLL